MRPASSTATGTSAAVPKPRIRAARSIVTWRSSLTSSRTRGAPCRPPASASQPTRPRTALRAAARQVTCACWQPVVRPNDAPAGSPSRSSSQPPATSSTTDGGRRHRVAAGVLVPARDHHVGGERRRQRPADHVAEVARRLAAHEARRRGGDELVEDRTRVGRRVRERQREPRAQRVGVEHLGLDAAVGQRLEEVRRVPGGGVQQVARVHRRTLPTPPRRQSERSARGRREDRRARAIDVVDGRRPVGDRDPHRAPAAPRRSPPIQQVPSACTAATTASVRASSSPKRTSTWLRTTSLSTSTPSLGAEELGEAPRAARSSARPARRRPRARASAAPRRPRTRARGARTPASSRDRARAPSASAGRPR